MKNSEKMLEALRQRFASCAICRMGTQVSLTGTEISLSCLEQFAREQETNAISVELVRPGLTDAMNYHLKQMKDARHDGRERVGPDTQRCASRHRS